MEQRAVVTDGRADLVVAMGSLQYARDVEAAASNLAGWLRPGGSAVVLVDSLVALVLELLRDGKEDEALARARTGQGLWAPVGVDGPSASLHLFDRNRLVALLERAGLVDVACHGLLVSASAVSGLELGRRLAHDPEVLAGQRELSAIESLAEVGKQLLATGRRAR
jgi:hypothetical protein